MAERISFNIGTGKTTVDNNFQPKDFNEALAHPEYPDYMQAVVESCANCAFWESGWGQDKKVGSCGKVKFEDFEEKAWLSDPSCLVTKYDFSCKLHQLKGEG